MDNRIFDVLSQHPYNYIAPFLWLHNEDDEKIVAELEKIYERLPKLDCGSCGSPSCHDLAEDIVRGFADETDCVFVLKERISALANEMVELDKKVKKT